MLFYTLNYLCSVFDSSAEKKKKSLKETSNSNSKQTKLTKWGEGICPVEIFAPPKFTLEERDCLRARGDGAPAPPGGGGGRAGWLAGVLRSVQQGAQCGRCGRAQPNAARRRAVLKQKGCCGGFSPHFVGSSLFSPTVYYTADGLTRNSFLRACVREQNCSNECMFDCFINF